MTEILKTPDEWQKEEEFKDRVVRDPDGWRNEKISWDEPITREKFMQLRIMSTLVMNTQ